jgi:hypothetical protein
MPVINDGVAGGLGKLRGPCCLPCIHTSASFHWVVRKADLCTLELVGVRWSTPTVRLCVHSTCPHLPLWAHIAPICCSRCSRVSSILAPLPHPPCFTKCFLLLPSYPPFCGGIHGDTFTHTYTHTYTHNHTYIHT